MINGCAQPRGGPLQEGHGPNNLLALRGKLGGLAGNPQTTGHNSSFQLLVGPRKIRGICCFDFVLAESRTRVLEGIRTGLLRFRPGLLDVNACVLKFRLSLRNIVLPQYPNVSRLSMTGETSQIIRESHWKSIVMIPSLRTLKVDSSIFSKTTITKESNGCVLLLQIIWQEFELLKKTITPGEGLKTNILI